MTTRRKLLVASASTVLLLLATAVVLPLLFRGKIEARLRAEINGAVDARVAWSEMNLSVLRDFPDVSLTVADPSVVGAGVFEGDTLASMQRLRLVLDLRSVVRFLRRGEQIVVREIVLARPTIALHVLADGTANWSIIRPSSPGAPATGGRAIGITLRSLRIDDATITLRDAHAGLDARILGLTETLRGDLAAERVTLSTQTLADSVSVRFGGVPWLSRARLALDADIDADLTAKRFTFTNDTLRLNALVLAFGGSVVGRAPDIDLDVSFAAPSTAFREILSLVPAVYSKDFEGIQASGTMSVSGTVRGRYGPTAFPSLDIRARVADGMFRYPSLPFPARDIRLSLGIRNPGGHVDSTVITLDAFHSAIGARTVDGSLTLRTPASDPDVDVRLLGSVDLADVARTVRFSNDTTLAGVVTADLAMRARLSDVDARRYERVTARGSVQASHVHMNAAAPLHAVRIDTAALTFTPRAAELTTLVGTVGSTDLRASGSLDNVLGFLLRNDKLRGRGTLASRHFALGEWISDEPATETVLVPAHGDFALTTSADRVTYGPLTATNVRGDVHVADQRATLNDLRMTLFAGTMVATGFYETTVATHPTFDMSLRLDSLDIPSAYSAVTMVQRIAPIGKWARGVMSGTVALRGSLDSIMIPAFTTLTGTGAVTAEGLSLQDMPLLAKLADALSFEPIRNPTIGTQRASFTMANGRVAVNAITVTLNGFGMTVGGSHGIDQTMDYDLALAVPRTMLGTAATGAVTKLVKQAGVSESAFAASDVAQLHARVTGTFTDPKVALDFAGMANSVKEAATAAVAQEVERRTTEVKQAADSALDAARERARLEGVRLVAEAQRQADTIRAAARSLAESAKRTAAERADSVVAKASGPLAQQAARIIADRFRKEADQQSERIIREADARADALVTRAKQQASALMPPGG